MALTKISTGGVKDDAASQAIIADEAVDEARLQVSNAGSNGQFLQKQSGNTGGLTWAAVDSTQEGTAVKSTGESATNKYLRTDGDGSSSWQTVPSDNTKANLTGAEFTGVVGLKGSSDQLKFYDADISNYVHVKSPTALTGNTTYTLPVDDGSSGQLLKTNGSGALSWTDPPSSGAWSKLTSGTFSSSDGSGNAVSKTITTTHLTSTHKLYKLSMLFSMSSTNWNTGLQVQNGGQWQANNYQYILHGVKTVSHTNSNRSNQNRIHFGDDNWYAKVYKVEIFFGDVDTSNGRRYFRLSGMSNNSTNGYADQTVWDMFASWDYAAAITGIRVISEQSDGNSGNFDHGWYVLEGCAI